MAGVEDEDEFKDALAAADLPPCSPKPTSKSKPATGGGGGLGRRLFASIPLPANLSAAIGRLSSPKPSASNVGLGLLLDAGFAPFADGPPASDAASGGSSLHLPSLADLQRQDGDDQVAGRGAGVGEEELGLVPAEEGWNIAEDCLEKEGLAVDVLSANRNCFPTCGQEEEGEQCLGDELVAAMAQDQELVVEQQGVTEDCAAVVEDENNYSPVEQCAGGETRALKVSNVVEANETVINQECAGGILDEAGDGVSVGLQEEENAVVEEQGVDVISVQDQHEVVEQCAGDQLTTTTDGNAAQVQEVMVEQEEGATEWYTALEAVEQCSDGGSKAGKDGDIVEEEKGAEEEGAVGLLLDAANDGAPVESQEEDDLVVAEQNEDVISSQDQHKVVEQSTGDQLRTTTDDNVVQDQEVVELEGETECYTVVEAVEQCSDDGSKTVKDGDIVEEEKGVVGAAKDGAPVESQEDLVVAEQNEDVISSQDQHKVVGQSTGDQLRTGTDDNAVQDQGVVELGETECYTAVEAVEEFTNRGSTAAKDFNTVEEKEKVLEQEVSVDVLDAAKDCVIVEPQEENLVVAEHVEDHISAQDQHKVVEQCTSGQLRTTMDDNAAEGQAAVEQEGAIFHMDATTDDIAVDDQDKEMKESDGDESRATRDENSVEVKDKVVDQGDVVDKHSVIKDGSGVELLENNIEQGEDGISLSDENNMLVLYTSDQLRATLYDHAVEYQKAVEHKGDIVERVVTTDGIAREDQEKEVEQSAGDESRSTKDENGLEDTESVDPEDVINMQGVINDHSCVVVQEEGVVVAEQGGDAMCAGDEGNTVEQCTNDQLRATMEDNAAEFQELVEQEGAIFEKGMTVGGITVEDRDKETKQSAGDKSSVTEGENVMEDIKKVDQGDAINRQGTAKEDSGLEPQEEDNIVDPVQGVDDLSVLDECNVMAQCTSDQLRTTMEDNAAELQEVVEQEGAIFEKGVASDGITVEDQDKEMEQSAGDESRATKGQNAVEDKKVYQEDAIDKQGAAKDGNGVESHEENMVVPDQGIDGVSVLDEGNVVPQCFSDQLRATTDNNAAVDPEVVEQEGVGCILGAGKVGIAVEELRKEDVMVAEQIEDGVFVQDQDEAVEQCNSDQLRIITDHNAVEDQEVHREKIGLSEGYPQRPGKLNCRFYMSTGSCSYGSSCHFNHPRLKAKLEVSSFPFEQRNHEAEFLELNRVGLPIREGARKCTYYMRNGMCRYGKKCCFNHPEQVLDVQLHTATGWDDTNLPSSPHSKKSPEHGTMDDTSSGSEILPPNILRMLLPQNVPHCTEEKEMRIKKDPDWASASDDSDGCCSADSSDGPLCKQEHGDYPERPECPILLKFGNCRFASSCRYYYPKYKFRSTYHPEDKFQSRYHPKENSSRYHPKKEPALSGELMVYPDRPGEPECPFYVKTGSCKFGANCKFHHPKDITPSMQGPASPKRSVAANEHHPAARTTLQDQIYQQQKFPERPGQPDCQYYMQFGKCKFQSACIFNHPKDVLSSGWHPAECPFYMKTGTCQFGSACEFYHPKDLCSSREGVIDRTDYGHDFATKSQNVLQQQEQAIYPERPGELECPHYMKHGYCKFQMNCKFHHPRDRLPKK